MEGLWIKMMVQLNFIMCCIFARTISFNMHIYLLIPFRRLQQKAPHRIYCMKDASINHDFHHIQVHHFFGDSLWTTRTKLSWISSQHLSLLDWSLCGDLISPNPTKFASRILSHSSERFICLIQLNQLQSNCHYNNHPI